MSILEIYAIGVVVCFIWSAVVFFIAAKDDTFMEMVGIAIASLGAVLWPWILVGFIWDVLTKIYHYFESVWFKYKANKNVVKKEE